MSFSTICRVGGTGNYEAWKAWPSKEFIGFPRPHLYIVAKDPLFRLTLMIHFSIAYDRLFLIDAFSTGIGRFISTGDNCTHDFKTPIATTMLYN